MAIGVVMQETMSGWMQLDAEGAEQPFEFSLRAYTPHLFRLGAPRRFKGEARFARDGVRVPVDGVLTLKPSGPRYELDLTHPAYGRLHVEGEKQYRLRGFVRSLVTCPLAVYAGGARMGSAEVAYRDSVLAFAFTAIRLVREEDAFGAYA